MAGRGKGAAAEGTFRAGVTWGASSRGMANGREAASTVGGAGAVPAGVAGSAGAAGAKLEAGRPGSAAVGSAAVGAGVVGAGAETLTANGGGLGVSALMTTGAAALCAAAAEAVSSGPVLVTRGPMAAWRSAGLAGGFALALSRRVVGVAEAGPGAAEPSKRGGAIVAAEPGCAVGPGSVAARIADPGRAAGGTADAGLPGPRQSGEASNRRGRGVSGLKRISVANGAVGALVGGLAAAGLADLTPGGAGVGAACSRRGARASPNPAGAPDRAAAAAAEPFPADAGPGSIVGWGGRVRIGRTQRKRRARARNQGTGHI